MVKKICYLVDSLTWIQAQRAKDLQPYLPDHQLTVITPRMVEVSGASSYDAYWLASWRIVLANPWLLDMLPMEYTMGSVTSHYNIGGGLKPELCFRKGADPTQEFDRAIETLKMFRVVTCNSKILYDLLSPHLPKIVLAQNGVDVEFFRPSQWRPMYNKLAVRVGWVGRVKGAKNFHLLRKAYECFPGWVDYRDVPVRKEGKPPLDRESIRSFFQCLEFLACLSFHEGTPNPSLEAASCGVPLITTPVGNMPELIREGETGWFIEPTAESLIATMERLQYLEPWQYRHMSEAIREEILANWTWKRQAEPYRKVLETVCP